MILRAIALILAACAAVPAMPQAIDFSQIACEPPMERRFTLPVEDVIFIGPAAAWQRGAWKRIGKQLVCFFTPKADGDLFLGIRNDQCTYDQITRYEVVAK